MTSIVCKTKNGAYMAPQVGIVFASDPYQLLASNSNTLSGDHDDGDDGGEIGDAKGFGLDDDWGNLWDF